jgi:hypothetical protein
MKIEDEETRPVLNPVVPVRALTTESSPDVDGEVESGDILNIG